MSTLLEEIADYVSELKFSDLTDDVKTQGKYILLDSLASAYSGVDTEVSRMVLEVVREFGGNPQATVLADGSKTSIEHAATANGVAMRALDYNDLYLGPAWTGHPSDNIASLLACAEMMHASGEDFLAALVATYEVHISFPDLPATENFWHRGWHHSAINAYAAAAGSAKLMGLGASEIAHAMALSGARANTFSEIRHGHIPMDKALSAPLMASRSLMSVCLAKKGFTGQLTLLEGKYGFKYAVAGGIDISSLVPEPKVQPKIMKTGLKPYPVEAMIQPLVEAAIDLRNSVSNLEDIERITIKVHREALVKPSWDESKMRPVSRETADHSFPYCVAVALLAGEVTQEQFSEAWLKKDVVERLIERTVLVVDDDLTRLYESGRRPGAVEIELHGSTISRQILDPLGSPERPMTEADIRRKFYDLAGIGLTKDRATLASIAGRILQLEREADLSELMTVLARESGANGGALTV